MPQFNIGDRVIIRQGCTDYSYTTPGSTGEIISNYSGGTWQVRFDFLASGRTSYGNEFPIASRNLRHINEYEEELPEEWETNTEFQVGDEVVLVSQNDSESKVIPIGSSGVIIGLPEYYDSSYYLVDWKEAVPYPPWWSHKDDMELASKKETVSNIYGYSPQELKVVRKIKQMEKRFLERRTA